MKKNIALNPSVSILKATILILSKAILKYPQQNRGDELEFDREQNNIHVGFQTLFLLVVHTPRTLMLLMS